MVQSPRADRKIEVWSHHHVFIWEGTEYHGNFLHDTFTRNNLRSGRRGSRSKLGVYILVFGGNRHYAMSIGYYGTDGNSLAGCGGKGTYILGIVSYRLHRDSYNTWVYEGRCY